MGPIEDDLFNTLKEMNMSDADALKVVLDSRQEREAARTPAEKAVSRRSVWRVETAMAYVYAKAKGLAEEEAMDHAEICS